jgi:hypothetical protein
MQSAANVNCLDSPKMPRLQPNVIYRWVPVIWMDHPPVEIIPGPEPNSLYGREVQLEPVAARFKSPIRDGEEQVVAKAKLRAVLMLPTNRDRRSEASLRIAARHGPVSRDRGSAQRARPNRRAEYAGR